MWGCGCVPSFPWQPCVAPFIVVSGRGSLRGLIPVVGCRLCGVVLWVCPMATFEAMICQTSSAVVHGVQNGV